MTHLNRRRFLQTSVVAGGGAMLLGNTKLSANVRGANEKIRVAVAGLNGRGAAHMGAYAGMKDVEIVYLVDPDSRTWESAARRVEKATGKRPKTVKDIRTVLEDKNVDAISIATPNHWHALMTIWACQAGKDVYVEKPSSHNVHEGRVTVEIARQNKRIVQHGTQSRTDSNWGRIAEVIKQGTYGKLKVARGLCYKRRNSIGFKKPGKAPSELDFNIWLGPAPDQPFHANLVHYNWHWFWDMGNGDMGNQGVHQMDIARWAIPGATLPSSVICVGGRFGYKDQGETANTQVAVFDYGETQLIFEVRGQMKKNDVTDMCHFEDGTIRADGRFYRNGSNSGEPLPKVEVKSRPGKGHFGNFIAAVRSRKESDLNADILEGHYSSALCHLANISYRLGTDVPFASKTSMGKLSPAALETIEKMEEHLSNDVGVKLKTEKLRVGPSLKFDAKSEQFVDNEKANLLLTRNYRAPFNLPKSV